jgi:LPS O-antigen subunit length determinant protein (WzzB/FepE family)
MKNKKAMEWADNYLKSRPKYLDANDAKKLLNDYINYVIDDAKSHIINKIQNSDNNKKNIKKNERINK